MKKRKFKVTEDDTYEFEIDSIECCGIYEINGLDTRPVNIIKGIIEHLHRDYRLLIFHDAIKYKRGEKLAAFIRRHKLGRVVASSTVWNPNTSRNIKMWTYYPDWKALRKFDKERIDYKEESNPWLY